MSSTEQEIDLEALAASFPSLTEQPINEPTLIAQVRDVVAGDRETAQRLLSDLMAYLSLYYHNRQELVDDSTYDQIVEIYEENFGEYTIVGAPVIGEGTTLDYYLGSLKKIKKEDEIERWHRKHPGPYVVEDKIDGISLLYVSTTVGGERVHKLYTRGHGKIGGDVSHIYPYLNIPPLDFDVAVRGEAVFTKEGFEKVGVDLKSARSGVSGAIGAKDSFDPVKVSEIKFVAYQIMESLETPETQILQLTELGFMVPWAITLEEFDQPTLKQLYEQRLEEAPYEMDGLVVYQNISAKYPSDKPPEHAVAFKINLKAVETTVTKVVWKTSREGRLIPVVHYEPVEWTEELDDGVEAKASATLTKATGHNAKYVLENKVGPGARILVTRSQKTIPYIVSVLQSADDYPFPDPDYFGNYDWDENQTHLVVKDFNKEMILAQNKFFFKALDIKNIGPARVEAMYDIGLTTLSTILKATPEDFMEMERVGHDLANKMYTEIHTQITNAPLAKVMNASGIFEKVGERRFKAILDVYPNLMESARCDTVRQLADAIREIKGFNALADEVAENLRYFADWLDEHPEITVLQPGVIMGPGRVVTSTQLVQTPQSCPTGSVKGPGAPAKAKGKGKGAGVGTGLVQSPGTLLTIVEGEGLPRYQQTLAGQSFVFSTFAGDLGRELTAEIEARGGRVASSVSKKTEVLVMRDMDDSTTKSRKSDEYGIPKMYYEDFRRDYLRPEDRIA